jgi:hypothetical protein
MNEYVKVHICNIHTLISTYTNFQVNWSSRLEYSASWLINEKRLYINYGRLVGGRMVALSVVNWSVGRWPIGRLVGGPMVGRFVASDQLVGWSVGNWPVVCGWSVVSENVVSICLEEKRGLFETKM